jgi:hypothetical protein
MADLSKHTEPTWERFFEFIYPCEESLTREEVQEDLRRLGIDVRNVVNRVQRALAASKGKAELAAARSRRASVLARLQQVAGPAGECLRDRLRGIIAGKTQGSLQAAYFRKLEAAATDEDLQSLLDDIHRLEAMSEGAEVDDPRGQ